jgi:peptide deformylase
MQKLSIEKIRSERFLKPDDPLLVRVSGQVKPEDFGSDRLKRDIDDMFMVARGEQGEKKTLVGLAAPQIGISKRLILVDIVADGKGQKGDLRLFINPEIVSCSEEEAEWYEGCFSTGCVCGIVSRSNKVKVKFQDEKGVAHEQEFDGYTARIFQHEIDHLNGKEFVTHITDDSKLHWVEPNEFPVYRDNGAWRNWGKKCSREKWLEIKGEKK